MADGEMIGGLLDPRWSPTYPEPTESYGDALYKAHLAGLGADAPSVPPPQPVAPAGDPAMAQILELLRPHMQQPPAYQANFFGVTPGKSVGENLMGFFSSPAVGLIGSAARAAGAMAAGAPAQQAYMQQLQSESSAMQRQKEAQKFQTGLATQEQDWQGRKMTAQEMLRKLLDKPYEQAQMKHMEAQSAEAAQRGKYYEAERGRITTQSDLDRAKTRALEAKTPVEVATMQARISKMQAEESAIYAKGTPLSPEDAEDAKRIRGELTYASPKRQAELEAQHKAILDKYRRGAATGGGGGAEGQTATNPQTGEKVIYKGGTWQPLQQ